MDSRRRITTSECPRCVRGGSEEIGDLKVFSPGIFNGPGPLEITEDRSLLALALLSPTFKGFFLPRENVCM